MHEKALTCEYAPYAFTNRIISPTRQFEACSYTWMQRCTGQTFVLFLHWFLKKTKCGDSLVFLYVCALIFMYAVMYFHPFMLGSCNSEEKAYINICLVYIYIDLLRTYIHVLVQHRKNNTTRLWHMQPSANKAPRPTQPALYRLAGWSVRRGTPVTGEPWWCDSRCPRKVHAMPTQSRRKQILSAITYIYIMYFRPNTTTSQNDGYNNTWSTRPAPLKQIYI